MPDAAADRGGVAELSRYLRVLSEPNRLEMLKQLQLPHQLHEIEVRPARPRAGLSPARTLSRQAVQEHLARLKEVGLVQARAAKRDGRPVTEYVVNHARLFIIVEELRRLNLLRAAEPLAEGTVAGGQAEAAVQLPKGVALVLVGGPQEGQAFPLGGAGPWVVGRDDDVAVALPYDPFVSKQNTRVWSERGALWAEDLAGSRNGTRVNWRRLGSQEQARLAPGDVLGVGRSLLVLRGEPA